jgi:DNA repair exonuclease SbcCD nuclease subunit
MHRISWQPMTTPVRFLHTADWQLGLRLNFVHGDAGARLRAERFEVVRRIAALAHERQVHAVLVAGDVFDDNGVREDTVQQALDAMAAFGDIPLLLLPGNHDPATPDSVLRRLPRAGSLRTLLAAEPVVLGDLELLPCPLLTRHQHDDASAWIPPRDASSRVRVALAHGAALDFSDAEIAPNRIDVPALLAKDVDYVALGDWHGVYQVDERAWYSGAPEATRFKEREPGHVLLVELDGPGAPPRVEPVRVARTAWRRRAVEFHGEAELQAFQSWLDELPDRSWTLLRLELTGQLGLAARARLDTMLEQYRQRLAHLRLRIDEVHLQPDEAELAALQGEGFLGAALTRLREEPHAANDDALRLLHRLLQDAES